SASPFLTSVGLGLISWLFSSASFAQASCEYLVVNEWNDGYTASIRLPNTQTSAIQSWQVSWQYQSNRITSSWNVQLSGNNPYTAANVGWNRRCPPGLRVEFGLQVSENGGAAELPTITASIWGSSGTSSSVASSTVSSAVAVS